MPIRSATFLLIISAVFMGSAPFITQAEATQITGSAGSVVKVEAYAEFNEPWAMTFLPGGELLVTEKSGTLLLVSGDGSSKVPVDGVPEVAYAGQGGLGDIILHPDYATNSIVYLSYAEQGRSGKKGAAVAMAKFHHDPAAAGGFGFLAPDDPEILQCRSGGVVVEFGHGDRRAFFP